MKGNIQQLFQTIWQDYIQLAPDAELIHSLFAKANNGKVINDHIALRTFNLGPVSLDQIAAPFLQAGYQAGGEYEFPARKLYARHYQHSDPELPKVFISELLVEQLSVQSQQIIEDLVKQVDIQQVESESFCCSGRPWSINLASYEQLLPESEYAAWLAAHGYHANHFTVSVNHLNSLKNLEDVNKKLIDEGFVMNESGGLIKGSPSVLLEQSSTLAKDVRVNFTDGSRDIPGCFYEFAKRYPMINGKLYQGFVAASADKIFESTDTKQP